MKKGTGTWYTEKGTEERPSATPGMVDLYRLGKFIATVPAQSEPTTRTVESASALGTPRTGEGAGATLSSTERRHTT